MSNDVGEFDVDWAPIDDEDCEELFADEEEDDPKDEAETLSDSEADEADVATHPSTQFTAVQSSESDASSVEEGEHKATDKEEGAFPVEEDWEDEPMDRPSWDTNRSPNEPIPKDSCPPPYAPSAASIDKMEVENLTAGNSRLATFSSNLKLRFNDTSGSVDAVEGGPKPDLIFPEDSSTNEIKVEDGFALGVPWSGDEAGGDDSSREVDGGDVFSSEAKTALRDDSEQPKNKFVKELSVNWMKFDDVKWDASKHEEEEPAAIPPNNGEAPTYDGDPSVIAPAKKKKKKQSFSLEAGLAKVSENSICASIAPEEEQNGGAQANELVSFWGEGQEEEEENSENANDPLSLALKAKHAEQPQDRSDERKLYDSATSKSPKSNYSQLSTPHTKSPPPAPAPGPGWLQKGLGSAMNLVASNLPFTKPKDKDKDEPIKDDNVEEVDYAEEVDDTPFPNYTNTAAAPIPQPGYIGASVAGVSSISDDSRIGPRRRSSTGEETPSLSTNDDIHHSESQQGAGYDSSKASMEKMNDLSEVQGGTRGIKFSKETKMADDFFVYPIFDLFIDLPHPSEVNESPASTTDIGAPTNADEDLAIQNLIRDSMQDISCLTFPDHDSSIVQEEQEDEATAHSGKTPMELEGFQYYTFTLRLESGALVYGHVRRYLPTHKRAVFRYDVGRRRDRALVLFTRFPGGDDFFATILRTLDAISSQSNSISNSHKTRSRKWFLQNLYQKHQRLCGHYAANLEDRRGGPHILTIQGLEFPDCMEHYAIVDSTHFFLPNNLLHTPVIPNMKTSHNCSVLPVMRCLGVVNSLRLMSALLSERRIIFVSISPTRLDRSVRAAIAMLAQGMLNWGHMCVPVLPPDLWSVLKSPSPYIVGVMAALAYRLELTDQLGDVVLFNLDENTTTAMGDQKLAKLVPDLCRSLSEAMLQKRRIALPENVATEKDLTALAILNSTSDILAQDLVEILKADKQTMNGTSVTAKHVATKAKKVVKSTLNYFLGGGKTHEEEGEHEAVDVKKTKQEKKMEPDYIYIEGCRNEAGEEAARLAFVSFFLRMLGNHEGYVYETEDSDFNFDREKFLQERKERGDSGNCPMWAMLLNFCETQMVRDFVKMREEHIRTRQPMPVDAPLFWQCMDLLEAKDIDFGILNVRSISRMMLQKTSFQQMLPSNVRRLAMAITSKRKFEGHLHEAIADLAELSRESGSGLYDVMSVIWLRTRDSKGLQWVHGYQAMRVLREVLLHGPLAAVADATDGIQRIRTLAFRKTQGYELISGIAREIFNLLSDRPKLFLRRRIAAEERRRQLDPEETPLIRDARLANVTAAFKDIHAAMNPALRPAEPTRRRASLSSKRASLTSRLPHRLSITKHILALDPDCEESITSLNNILPIQRKASQYNEFLHDTAHRPNESVSGSLNGDMATARRYVREIARKTQEAEKARTREHVRGRDSNAMSVELIKKQFMLLKVAIYICPIFYIFGNHEHFLTIVMFLWLSQQFQVFRPPVQSGSY